jgi:putative (di)nucleoside polyphosphate hydrolase
MSAGRRPLPYRNGVGALIFNGAGMVLVARRIDTPGDAWQLPQGGIKRGETPRQAVLRELREEIGTDRVEIVGTSARWFRYDLPEELLGRVWRGKYRGQEQRWFALRFTGSDTDIDLAAGGSPEFDAWRWAAVEELPALAVWFKRDLYAELVREFGPLAAAAADGGGGASAPAG